MSMKHKFYVESDTVAQVSSTHIEHVVNKYKKIQSKMDSIMLLKDKQMYHYKTISNYHEELRIMRNTLSLVGLHIKGIHY